jgi:hypothetical protein
MEEKQGDEVLTLKRIKSLAHFKREMKAGHRFKILRHFVKPEYTGQIRVPQVIQTNGMFSGNAGDRKAQVSQQNVGRGSWIAFGKASDWEFREDGVCVQKYKGNPIWEIQVLAEFH